MATLIIVYGCGGGGASSIEVKEEPGTVMGGSMCFDGTNIWATSITQGFDTNAVLKIVKLDVSGNIVGSFEPDENVSGDVAFDGQTLWAAYPFGWEAGSAYADHGAIYSVDPIANELTKEFTIPTYFDDLEGMSAAPGTLWVMLMNRDQEKRRIQYLYAIDPITRNVLTEHSFTDFGNCGGIAYLDGHVWALVGLVSMDLAKIDCETGAVEETYDLGMNVINGILPMDGSIFLFDEDQDLLFRFDPD
jgi:hypothetical protein